MENVYFSKNIIKVKELLNKLLNEKLGIKITNLELNNTKEISILSTLNSSSKNILNNLSEYENKIQKGESKEIKIPKLNLDEINKSKNNNKLYITKTDRKEESGELESILKKSKYKNKRNKEKPISTIFDYDASKTRVSFWQKDLENNSKLNDTPDLRNKNKSYITQNSSNKKEIKLNKTFAKSDSNNILSNKKSKKTKIKNVKCLAERANKETLTTPLRLHLNKRMCKHEIGNHTTRESNNLTLNTPQIIKKENKNKKKINKIALNFFSFFII